MELKCNTFCGFGGTIVKRNKKRNIDTEYYSLIGFKLSGGPENIH